MTFTLKELNTIKHCLECQIHTCENYAKESKSGGYWEESWIQQSKETQALLNKLNIAEF